MICFHHNDLDGRCAAAIVNKWFRARKSLEGDQRGDIVFAELDYKDRIPVEKILADEEIAIVDFSFKPEVMVPILRRNQRVIWIDHHKTAAAYDYGRELAGIRDFTDKGKSGCELTWEFFFPAQAVPRAVTLIGDRDAWRWEHGRATAEFNQGCRLYDLKPESRNWDSLLIATEAMPDRVVDICREGHVCLIFRDSFCADYAKSYGFETEFAGHQAFALAIYMFGSEAFGERFKRYPLCLSFAYDGCKWTVGLYSETIDVGEIARQHGGGGHKGAAGFTCDHLPFKRKD